MPREFAKTARGAARQRPRLWPWSPSPSPPSDCVLRPFRPSDAAGGPRRLSGPGHPALDDRTRSPYERAHAEDFIRRTCPEGWRDDSSYNFALVTKAEGDSSGPWASYGWSGCTAPSARPNWATGRYEEHRRRGYTGEAARAVAEWAFTGLGVERLEWSHGGREQGVAGGRARRGLPDGGNGPVRIVREGTRRDAWRGALLPSDWGLPSTTPYLPAPVADPA